MFTEDGLHCFGTPLPLLEFDQVPSKKPVSVQDQIVTDEHGRRRFHGAFTGGFSAGYWNTVGSKEGWTPRSFKSSRTEKTTDSISQCPNDFMDDEDRDEFGTFRLNIHDDYTISEQHSGQKRKFLQNVTNIIPGEPVLRQLIKPVKDKIAVRILKEWGWRPGQGVGPRQTRSERKKARERNKKEQYLIEKYGCELPGSSGEHQNNLTGNYDIADDGDDDDDDDDDDADNDDDDEEITFAPEDYELPPLTIKQNRYGIGYEPLNRTSVLGSTMSSAIEDNALKPLELLDKNNKKITFVGQAFGVGALEDDDDEDVYATDDMKRYDFSLDNNKNKKKNVEEGSNNKELVFGEFVLDLNPPKYPVYNIDIPFGWQPRNWFERKSRFEPIADNQIYKHRRDFEHGKQLSRQQRAELLGEEIIKPIENKNIIPQAIDSGVEKRKPSLEEMQEQYKERNKKTKALMEKITLHSNMFTKSGIINMHGEEESIGNNEGNDKAANDGITFKPFVNDAKKQERYDKFLACNLTDMKEIETFLNNIQPIELSLWDRKMELQEFIQAKKLYKPLNGIMSNRFIRESELKTEQDANKNKTNESGQVNVIRTKITWKAHAILLKRYNIADPLAGQVFDEQVKKKVNKISVFDYLEDSLNKKTDFQTPTVIPKLIPESIELTKQEFSNVKSFEKSNFEESKLSKAKDTEQRNNKTKKEFLPKTELEKQVVKNVDQPLTEKSDLFKCIFLDSEPEDGEDGKDGDSIQKESNRTKTSEIKNTTANLLLNNSPPRGIFTNLFTQVRKAQNEKINSKKITESQLPEKILFQAKSTKTTLETGTIYGPALPTNQEKTIKLDYNNINNQIFHTQLSTKSNNSISKIDVEEFWIEKLNNKKSESGSSDTSSTASISISTKRSKTKSKSKKKLSIKHKKLKHHKKKKDKKKSKKHKKIKKLK